MSAELDRLKNRRRDLMHELVERGLYDSVSAAAEHPTVTALTEQIKEQATADALHLRQNADIARARPVAAGVRWVSCSQEASWAASQHRHLAKPGALTTVCGASASHASVWRGNTTKPQCPECLIIWNTDATAARAAADMEAGKVVEFSIPAPEAPAPEPSPDWRTRYKGYAFRQLKDTRDRIARDLERDITQGMRSRDDLDRAAARLASYDDLITALETLKGLTR